jgi:hypothetical protein
MKTPLAAIINLHLHLARMELADARADVRFAAFNLLAGHDIPATVSFISARGAATSARQRLHRLTRLTKS